MGLTDILKATSPLLLSNSHATRKKHRRICLRKRWRRFKGGPRGKDSDTNDPLACCIFGSVPGFRIRPKATLSDIGTLFGIGVVLPLRSSSRTAHNATVRSAIWPFAENLIRKSFRG
jgi:hypothetical protein